MCSLYSSPDGRWLVINDGEGMVFSFGLDYEYQFPGFSDWDEGARPYLEIFLTLHPKYNDADFDRLIEDCKPRLRLAANLRYKSKALGMN